MQKPKLAKFSDGGAHYRMQHEPLKIGVLLVSYVYPPIGFAGTFRALRLSKYLARLGFRVSVLTLKEQADLPNDPALLKPVQELVTIYRTGTIDFWRSYQQRKNAVLGLSGGATINKLCSFALSVLNQPDHMVYWTPFAITKGLRVIRKEQIQIVITTSPPHSEHLIGLLLKKVTGAKWIADFRDPMVDNIVFPSQSPMERRILSALERFYVKHSDAIVMNTEFARARMLERYGSAKIHVIRNAYDPDDFRELVPNRSKRFMIAHIGSIYGFRKTEAFFEAVSELHRMRKISPETFRVMFVGLNDPSVEANMKRFQLEQYVETNGMASHAAALQLMTDAHLLLLIKGFGENSAGQIPGKLFEYLGTRNRILCIGPRDTEAAQIILEAHAGTVVGDDVTEIQDALNAEFQAWHANANGIMNHESRQYEDFTSLKMAEGMGKIIESLLPSQPRKLTNGAPIC